MSRSSQEQFAQRLAETEQTMIRLRSSYRVEQALAAKFSVLPRQVRRWMQQVRRKWREEATSEDQDRTQLRADMHTTLNELLAQALNRTQVVKDADGNPMLDPNPNSPTFGKPLVRANPDLQRALHACIQIRALHALDQPAQSKVTIDLSKDINVMPDMDALKPEHVKMVRTLIEQIAPGKDIKQLAGDWFAKSGEEETPPK